MKKIYSLLFLLFIGTKIVAQSINYNFTPVNGSFVYNVAPTALGSLGSGVDDALSAATNIGFTFQYGCVNYTQFKASSNGWLTFNTAITGSNNTNNLATSTDRPIIAPLWDDLATGAAGNVNYKLTGVTPNRVLTIEWKQMEWRYTATTWGLSLQVKLYETSNRIEFVYDRNVGPATNLDSPSASIGLSGTTSGDYYSLNGTGGTPLASKIIETTTLSIKPSSGQVYQWDPIICSGVPSAGTAVASPSVNCVSFTANLSLLGSTSACGLTYLWYHANAIGGPYSAIGTTTSVSTNTFAVVSGTPKFFQCVVTCGASSATTAPITASVGTVGSLVTLPFAASGQTTCGKLNDFTSTNSTICGSSAYYDGEDVLYRFTPTSSGQMTAILTSTGTSTGLMLYNGCPSSAGTCVSFVQDFNGSKQLCATLTAGTTYYLLVDSWSVPSCNPYDISISNPSSASTPSCNMSYTASPAVYNFVNFTGTPLPTTDDVLFNSIVNFGFPFCFDGVSFNGGYVASNQAFVLQALPCYPNIQTTTYAAGGVGTGYTITGPAPINATSVPRNAILAPWHDINPASTATVAASKTQFTVTGTAPNRVAIISWENIPMYSTPCETVTAQRSSSQIKLFETTNRIEIHVRNKQVCATFNNGQAILGLHNYDGTKYVFPVNATVHNATAGIPYNNWTMTNTAYQFNTTCGLTPGSCQNLVVPLGFNTFYAERVNGINNLYWETSAEEKSTIYKVQRSTDGVNFIDIGQVNALGSANKYSFEDKNAAPGIINYYRIASVEIGGKISYTFIYPLGNGQNEILNVSQIYPNPAINSFMIALDSKQNGTATINIYDVFGRLVKSTTNPVYGGVTQYEIYVEDLRYGFYFVEVLNSFNELISKQKFLKN